jgi:thiol-disulfide isomerase/thioredoxin
MNRCSKMFSVPAAHLAASFVLCGLIGLMLPAGQALAAEKTPTQALFEVAARPQAPDFFLEDMDGKKHHLSDLRGKVVLVNFWATWCPPCKREMPSIERLSHILKGTNFEIIAVNVAESLDTVFSFTGSLDPIPTFPIVFDTDSRVLKAWPVIGLPTTFILDKQGRIAYRVVGGRDFDDPVILAQIRGLIEAQ